MVRIALVDDDIEFHALFSKYIRNFFHKNNILHELRLYNCPETLRYDLKEGRQSDLYFLDICTLTRSEEYRFWTLKCLR